MYCVYMTSEVKTVKRIMISLNQEDVDLAKSLQESQGIKGMTAIIRFALKQLEKKND